MAAKTEGSVAITLPELKIAIVKLTIVGDTPLIVHAWSAKAKKEMLDKQMGVPRQKKERKDPLRDFEESLYRLPDGGYGFPSVGIKSAAVTACTSVANITKVAARQAFHMVGEPSLIQGVFANAAMRLDLVRIEGAEPEMREDMVRIGMGTADIRYRAQFWPWSASLTIRINAAILSAAEMANLLNNAGFGVGIGEWRPERDGQNGMFHVGSTAETANASAAKRRARS